MGEPHADALDEARIGVGFAGYCVLCNRIVVRDSDGGCPQGHPAEAVAGRLVLIDNEPVPHLGRFNIAAFLLPFIWGPAHEQWAGALFLPIWLFLDSIVGTAGKGGVPSTLGAVVVVGLTLAFQAFFATRANGAAYRRVIDRLSVEEYSRRQRAWTLAAAPVALFLAAWIVWFHAVVAPTLGTV